MKISELVEWLYLLSDAPFFKIEMQKMTSFYEGDIIETLDSQKAKFKVAERDLITGEYEFIIVSIEDEIIRRTYSTINTPAKNIHPQIQQANKLIERLEVAEKIADASTFHKSFPKYFEAVEATKEAIRKAEYLVGVKKEKRGNPDYVGLSAKNKARIISLAENLLLKAAKEYEPRKGAYVSEYLKNVVFDELKDEIPDLSIHIVSRTLLKHYRTKLK